MTWDQYNREFDKAVVDVQKQQGQTMVYLGGDALSLLKQRVQEEGVNAEGKRFEDYSKKPMLANCSSMTKSACSRIAGSKTKRKELSWVTLERGGISRKQGNQDRNSVSQSVGRLECHHVAPVERSTV